MNARASGAAALACLIGLAASALAQPVGAAGALSVTTTVVEPAPLVTLAVAIILTALAFLAFRARGRGLLPGPEAFGAAPEHRAALYGLIPAILGAHLAVKGGDTLVRRVVLGVVMALVLKMGWDLYAA